MSEGSCITFGGFQSAHHESTRGFSPTLQDRNSLMIFGAQIVCKHFVSDTSISCYGKGPECQFLCCHLDFNLNLGWPKTALVLEVGTGDKTLTALSTLLS